MVEETSKNEMSAYEEKVLARIPGEILILSLGLSLPAGLLFGPAVAGLFILGGGMAVLSFMSLKRWLAGPALGDRKKALAGGVAFYFLRLFLIGAVFSIIIFLCKKKALASAAGFSTVILVFLAEAAVALARKPTWKN